MEPVLSFPDYTKHRCPIKHGINQHGVQHGIEAGGIYIPPLNRKLLA
jgi:hypothetical protein